MGYGFKIKCRSCDFEEEFFLGTGMMYYPLEKLIHEVVKDKRARGEILEILENYKVNEHNFGYELFRCEECDKLYRKFNVELNYDEGKIYKYDHKCTKCKKPLKVVDEKEIEDEKCPKCHHNELVQEGWILWD